MLNSGFTLQVFVPVETNVIFVSTERLRIVIAGGPGGDGENVSAHQVAVDDAVIEIVNLVGRHRVSDRAGIYVISEPELTGKSSTVEVITRPRPAGPCPRLSRVRGCRSRR